MNVVIAGAGALGRQAAAVLSSAPNVVTLIESDPDVAATLERSASCRVVSGDACDLEVLEEAGIMNADVVVAATGSDEDNLVIALICKRRYEAPQVAARINDPNNAWLFDERWGVDVAVSPAVLLVSLIEEATRSADTVGLVRLGQRGPALIETVLNANSRVAGMELGSVSLPAGALVGGVVRNGKTMRASDDLQLQAGDEILIFSESAGEAEIRACFQG